MHSGICFKNAYVYRLVVQVVDIYFININKSHASWSVSFRDFCKQYR